MIALAAGLTVCIAGIAVQMETERFLKVLVIVLLSFYILGSVARLILDKNFKEEVEIEATEGPEEEDESAAAEE